MKHSLSITVLLVALFFAAQLIGLGLLSLDGQVKVINGRQVFEHKELAFGERPDLEGGSSLLYLLGGIAIGTVLLFVLIKFKAFKLWKLWFFIAVWFSTSLAFGVILPATIALILCLALSIWKVFWPNPVIHNLTEIFMYAGLAIIIVPMFSLGWAITLLLVISVYDMIAVWYSKHMVVMAKAQTESNLFAGLYIPKSNANASNHASTLPPPKAPDSVPKSSAILGGGDIAFPLLFSGVVMDWLITKGASRVGALYEVLIITICATIALGMLFFYAKKDRFYPAMPFLSAGCFIGLFVVALL